MSEYTSRLTLWFKDKAGIEHEIDMGSVYVSESITKRVGITPIVSMPMNNAFPVENGNSHSYTINFKRMNPHPNNDRSTKSVDWTNAKWYSKLTEFVDRWQMKTDGCRIHYDSDNEYIPSFDVFGYIKQLDRTYNNQFNEMITGTLTVAIGTSRLGNMEPPTGTAVNVDDMELLISNEDASQWYVLKGGDIDCIKSVEITGGINQYIECATIKLSKKAVQERIPQLTIMDGVTQMYVGVMGERHMIVSQASISSDVMTITAYADAYIYNNVELQDDMSGDAFYIIESILTDISTYGVTYVNHFIHSLGDYPTDILTFKAGRTVSDVLSICALYLNAMLYFCDGNAYLVDYTLESPEDSSLYRDIDITISDGGRQLGDAVVDRDGMNSACNICTILCNDNSDPDNPNLNAVAESTTGNASINKIKKLNPGTFRIPELTEYDPPEGDTTSTPIHQGQTFVDNYVRYLCYPRRDLLFEYKEMYGRQAEYGRSWAPTFSPSVRAKKLVDSRNGVTIDDKDYQGNRALGTLLLTRYTRRYPECTSEYTFGQASEVSLPNYVRSTATSMYDVRHTLNE